MYYQEKWKCIALQCCVDFCHTATWYICPLPHEPPFQSPPYPIPLGCHRVPEWAPFVTSHFSLAIYITHGNVYSSIVLFQFVQSSSSPCCVHKFVLYVYVSTPALQIDSIVLFLWIPIYLLKLLLFSHPVFFNFLWPRGL